MPSLDQLRNFKHRINPTEEIEGRGSFGYYVVRPVSLYFTWLILLTPLRANHVTLLHMAFGIGGSILLAFPSHFLRLVGCGMLYMGFVLDNVDGEVARYRKEVSITGKYIDTIAHTIVNSMMFFCFGMGSYWDTGGNVAFVVLGFLAALFCLRLDTFVMYAESAKAFMQNLDKRYEYYANIEGRIQTEGKPELEFISKRADDPLKRISFAAFAYPGTLHIMTACVCAGILGGFLHTGWMRFLPAGATAIYGVLLPIRRFLTIRRIIVERETEARLKELEDRQD